MLHSLVSSVEDQATMLKLLQCSVRYPSIDLSHLSQSGLASDALLDLHGEDLRTCLLIHLYFYSHKEPSVQQVAQAGLRSVLATTFARLSGSAPSPSPASKGGNEKKAESNEKNKRNIDAQCLLSVRES